MTSPWTVTPGGPRIELDSAGRGEMTFMIDNLGPVDQRLVFDVVPGEGAARTWFNVPEPQVLVAHGQAVRVQVQVAVPPGTPAGPRTCAGRAYSAERAPEESSVISDPVTFDVRLAQRAVPWWRRWWWALAAGALVLIVLAVVLILALGGDDPPTDNPPVTTTPTEPTAIRKTGDAIFNQNETIDLDDIVVPAPAGTADLLYRPQLPSDGFIVAQNGATLAKIGPSDRPGRDCVRTPLGTAEVQVSTWQVGEVLCVRTNGGRLAFVVLDQKVSLLRLPPPPPQLRLSATSFD